MCRPRRTDMQGALDVPQTDAVALPPLQVRWRRPRSGVAHCQRELGLSTVRRLKSGRDDNLAAISERRNAVLHGIFDQRLQEERWHADTLQRWWHVDLDSQAILESRSLDIQIRFGRCRAHDRAS